MKTIVKILAAGAVAGLIVSALSLSVAGTEESVQNAERDYSKIAFEMPDVVLAKTEAKVFESADGTALNYRVYYSPAYSADKSKDPAAIIVFLHGSGGKGDDNTKQITDQIATVNFLVSESAEEVLGDIPYIVIAPQCPEGTQWVDTPYANGSYSIDAVAETPHLKAVHELILDTLEKDNADSDNVILGGISMGGYGTWDLALRHPETFNAIFPICGGGDPSKAALLENMGVWAFHCDGDASVPVSGSRDMMAALEDAGVSANYTEFNKVAHNAWMPAMTEVSDPYLLEWIFEDCLTYNVTVTASKGGVVESTTEKLRKGDTMRVEISPDEGYQPTSLYVNGTEVEFISDDSGTLYYECVVTGNMAVNAEFEKLAEESSELVLDDGNSTEDSYGAESGSDGESKKGGLSTAAKVGILAAAGAVAGGIVALLVSKKKKK